MLLLKQELEQNNIADWVSELLQHEALIAELDYALRPVIHEGKIRPYGFIVLDENHEFAYSKLNAPSNLILEDARRLADGCHSFVVFRGEKFCGVLPLEQSANDESKLVQLQQKLNAVICTTDSEGTTKLFCADGVLIHQYRRWQKKPCVKCTVQSICRYIPQLNAELLQTVLEFCFHELSPRKIGATLVWCLTPIPTKTISSSHPSINQEVEVKIGPTMSNAILRHVLTYTDGAVVLSQDGVILDVGAHLKYSELSTRLIETHGGTRHTSAKRFSYDFPETLIFVVSSDGPVTVFSDGVNMVNLTAQPTDDSAPVQSETVTIEADAPASRRQKPMRCPICGKKLKIRVAPLIQPHPQDVCCPVCNHPLNSLLNLAANSDATVSVVKDLLLNSLR